MPFRNPFVTDPGGMPPYLAGREREVRAFARALDSGPHVALVGVRGTGKTVLLRVFEEVARDKGWLTVRLELNERHCSEFEFLRTVRYHLHLRGTVLSLAAPRRSIGFTAASSDREPAAEPEAAVPMREQLITDVHRLTTRSIASGNRGLVLLLDEFQSLRDETPRQQFALSALLEAITALRQEPQPVLLVIAGLPTLRRNLTDAKTYAERMFSYHTIGNLSPEAARDAMTRPLAGQRVQLAAGLVERLVRETGGYAYLVQFFPFYLVQNAPLAPGNSTCMLDLEHYRALLPSLLDQLDEQFYRMRFERASDDERDLLFALAGLGPEFQMRSAQQLVRWDRNRLNQMVLDLVSKGLVMRITRGRYGYALPLFHHFLDRERRRERR